MTASGSTGDADALRDEMVEGQGLGPTDRHGRLGSEIAEVIADALLPLIETREAAAAARALTEAADYVAWLERGQALNPIDAARVLRIVRTIPHVYGCGDGRTRDCHRCDLDDALAPARAASQAAPPEETHEHTMTDWDGTRATCRCGASRAVHGPWRMPSPAAPVSPEENTT